MTQRDIGQVLREKIADYNKVLREVQALQLVAPLLTELTEPIQEKPDVAGEKVDVQKLIVPEEQKRNMWP